jgi:[ribosomal protein S5]-alanine N-acetyltransferase
VEEVERWYERLASEPYGWIIDVDGAAIGDARLHWLEPANRRARFAIGIFSPSDWGRGIRTETTRLVLRYAFKDLGLHRVDLRVLADNVRVIALYERCGFVRGGIERETVADGDGWRSDLIMSILEEEYRQASATWTA